MMAGFADRGGHLLPDLRGPDALRQSEAGSGLAARSPVIVTADPADCSFHMFEATGHERSPRAATAIKDSHWSGLSVNYDNVAAPKGTAADASKIGNDV